MLMYYRNLRERLLCFAYGLIALCASRPDDNTMPTTRNGVPSFRRAPQSSTPCGGAVGGALTINAQHGGADRSAHPYK